MENQNEIVLKINRDEIYFSCKGYSEEFINSISDVINQRQRALVESSPTSKPEESSSGGEIENKKTETIGASGNTVDKSINKKEARRLYWKEYSRRNKDKISAQRKERFAAKKAEKNKETEADERGDKAKEPVKSAVMDDKEAIISDIKNGLNYGDLRDKYGIKAITYARLKKIARGHKKEPAEKLSEKTKDGIIMKFGYPDCYKKTKITKEEFNAPLNSIKVDINKVQEKMYEKPFGPLSANPKVRDWQKDMIARGL
ncbi:MAG: hypothetical protein M1467_04375 [Deltaproteobacteria bacterium]|jgi:hypothetical protein|nr:hypothetical protein [Deltaproteobacteria bacterium]